MAAEKRGERSGWRRAVDAEERAQLARHLPAGGGLCPGCRHLRLLRSARSVFVRCALAERDPSFPRYPVLPVVECTGFEPWRAR